MWNYPRYRSTRDYNLFGRSDRYLDELLRSKEETDAVDREVERVLFQERVIYPLIRAFKRRTRYFVNLWEAARGLYRRTFAKVRGGANAPPGAGTGAGGVSSAQFVAIPAPPAPIWPVPGVTSATISLAGAGFSANSPPSTQPIEDAGIRAGEVVAYRCWVLRNGLLHSATMSHFVWHPGKPVEGDPNKIGEGVHGFKSRHRACSYISGYEHDGTIVVSGTVDLWGDVYEHEWGYRASKAAVASIDDSPYYDAAALRKLYRLGRRKKKKESE
jgi:hypothetical protein